MKERELMADHYRAPEEVITVKVLKEMLADFPDDTLIRLESHYVGYGLNANVLKKLQVKNMKTFNEPTGGKSIAICSDYLAEKVDTGKKPRIITKEQEDAAPFELKSAML